MADIRTWSKDLIIELITLYKSFPCLWKIKSEEYKNKNLKDEAYKKIIDFCEEKGFSDANRDFVVKKLQSLRGSFRKELKKVTDSQRSGRGTDDVYKSSLWYYDYMLFTRDQEVPSNSISNLDLENDSISDDNFHQHVISSQEEGRIDVEVGETEQQNTVAIYAESIINNVLRKGLLKKLTEDTDLCDSYCNKNIQRSFSVQSSHSRSSYESQSLLNHFIPSTSSGRRDQDHTEENLNLTQLRTYYEHSNLMDE
ncbi:hypothetical protein ACJJTC_010869 [Scirpophaga incertulas]